MASLAPHRVKVDGKSLFLSSVTVNVWLSATIDPQASRSRRFNSFFSRTKKFIVEQETAVTLLGLPFPLRSVFLLNVPPSLSLQSSLNDSSMWRASRTAGFSTTTSGTAGDRPSASTGRRSTRPGGSTGGGGDYSTCRLNGVCESGSRGGFVGNVCLGPVCECIDVGTPGGCYERVELDPHGAESTTHSVNMEPAIRFPCNRPQSPLCTNSKLVLGVLWLGNK